MSALAGVRRKSILTSAPAAIRDFLVSLTVRAFRGQVKRILFIKFAEQGSTVLAYPAIQRAVKMVGRENTYFVVFEENRFVLDLMKILPQKNVITVATNSLPALFITTLRAIIQSRRLGIDAVVDLEFLTRFSA